jgi:hypothetical protein
MDWDLCLNNYDDVCVVTREPTWDFCLSNYDDVEGKYPSGGELPRDGGEIAHVAMTAT